MRIAEVALRVSDVGRSADFYARLLGLRVAERSENEAVLAAREDGRPILTLRRAALPDPAPRRAAGLYHCAFLFATRGDLAAALRRLVDSGRRLTGASDHAVSEALYLDDPDRVGIELYRDRPRESWPAPGSPLMPTLPLDLDRLLSETDADGREAAGTPVAIGHVHLKVRDVDEAVAFWTRAMALRLTMRAGADAAFLADGDYHHHVGVNSWHSRGAALEPPDRPGLDSVTIALDQDPSLERARQRLAEAGAPVAEVQRGLATSTPDGVPILLEGG